MFKSITVVKKKVNRMFKIIKVRGNKQKVSLSPTYAV